MNDHTPEAVPPDPSTDIDVYCLECGYNLRGLSGDPRRCPECGHLNPMGDLFVPAELITAQLRRMETAPTACVGIACVTIAALAGLLIDTAGDSDGWKSEPPYCYCLPLVFFGPPVWLISLLLFRESCAKASGWGRALWRYHIYGLGLIATFIGILMLGAWATKVARATHQETLQVVISPVQWTIVFLVAVLGGRWAQRKVRELLDPLQREVAATLARERLRSQLQR